MTKKKPSKKKTKPDIPPVVRTACREIADDILAEVARIEAAKITAINARLARLEAESNEIISECGQIIDRLQAIEAKAKCAEPKTWLGRLHRGKWFCLPWCR